MQEFKYGEIAWANAKPHGGDTATVVQECKIVQVELKKHDGASRRAATRDIQGLIHVQHQQAHRDYQGLCPVLFHDQD